MQIKAPSHTPGPWVLDSNGPGHEVVLARGGTHAVAAVQGTDDHLENLANGRLIVAAPDLLAAAKAAFVALPMAKHNDAINRALRDAIAKAEGQPT